ncbi:MAG: tetratricopeptide repeat protein [Cytophagaceae bacterium]
MKEVEAEIWEANQDDYNRPLYIFPKMDTILQKSLVPSTDYIISKSALPVQKHKNSNWVDPSYLLIGKSRIYRGEYPLATQTFKYVNTNGKHVDHKQQALILLIRTYIFTEDYQSIPAVVEYLKKKKLSNNNKRDFHLTMGYFNQIHEEYDKVIGHLTEAIPYIKKRDQKSRMHFILGQLYQLKEDNKNAYEHYHLVLKHNPPYELSFFTKLYMAQVSDLSDASDVHKIEKYFKKLLKDQKNLEYKDKIYYELGLFKLKQNDYKKGINYLEKSIQANAGNQFQKARSYLELGRLYYEKLQKYELAKAYYDSTIQLWDKKDKEYKPIARRQEVLADFVEQLNTIQREDSLQRLASMDSIQLSQYLDKIIFDEEKKQREEMRKLELAAKRKSNAAAIAGAGMADPNATWYFYNPASMNMGRIEFEKKWGKRKLEDNWRRSMKEVTFDDDDEEEEEEEVVAAVDSAAIRAQRKEQLYKNIPFTKAEIDTSNSRLEVAHYKLGKIYDLNLLEYDNSILTFQKLIKRFPESEYRPEVLYFLYLLTKDKGQMDKSEEYKNTIFSQYPNSLYAKIIKNPNYLAESKVLNEKVAVLYKQAYDLYNRKEYFQAQHALNDIQQNYPESDIEDKLVFLGILIKGKTQSSLILKTELTNFIETYTNSVLLKRAEDLLETTEAYIAKKESGQDNNYVKYINNLKKPQYFMAVMPKNKINTTIITNQFNSFNKKLFNDENQKENILLDLNDSTVVIVVKEFKSIQAGNDYIDDITSIHSFLNAYKPNYQIFLITDDNYKLFEQSKNLEGYLRFYKTFYE